MLVTPEWKIESDDICVTLYRRRIVSKGKNEGQEYWEATTYHQTIQQAIKELVRREVNSARLDSLSELGKKIDKLYKLVEELNVN